MQACLLGHSLSNLQPSSTWGSGTRGRVEEEYQTLIIPMIQKWLYFTEQQKIKLTWHTSNSIWVSSKSRLACANASVVSCRAICISCTFAWINTFLTLACQCWWAVRISQTLILFASNGGIRIRPIAWRAWTNCSVIFCRTNSINTTSFKRTRIYTVPVNACLCQRTVWVTFASR